MAKSLKDIQILDETGNPVTQDELEDFLSDRDIVMFSVEKGGKTRQFAIEIDNSQVTSQMLISYQRAMAEITIDAQSKQEELELIIAVQGEEATEQSGEEMHLVVALNEIEERMAKHDADLLCNLVVATNYPGKDLTVPAVLTERIGAGPEARKALKAYFFGGLTGQEEATGTTETAPTETPSDSSAQTDNSEAIPPTS